MSSIDWSEITQTLRGSIQHVQYQNWIQPLRYIQFNHPKIMLSSPTVFHRDWVESFYKDKLIETFVSLYGFKPEIKIIVGNILDNNNKHQEQEQEQEQEHPLRIPEEKKSARSFLRLVETPHNNSNHKDYISSQEKPIYNKEPENLSPPPPPISSSPSSAPTLMLVTNTTHQLPVSPTSPKGSLYNNVSTQNTSGKSSVLAPALGEYIPKNKLITSQLPKHQLSLPFGFPEQKHPFLPLSFNSRALKYVDLFVQKRFPNLSTLLIQGGVGQGKTHLTSEIAQRFIQSHPSKKAKTIYTNGETFSNEMSTALRMNAMDKFKQKYLESDILVFDDIHLLAKRIKTQEVLLGIFNALIVRGGQFACTLSSFGSQTIQKDFIPSLKSRLLSGMIAQIESPTEEEKLKLLQLLTEYHGLSIRLEVLQSLAIKNSSDLRELLGLLFRIHLKSTLMDGESYSADSSEIQSLIESTLEGEGGEYSSYQMYEPAPRGGSTAIAHPLPKTTSIQSIFDALKRAYNLNHSDLLSKSRKGTITWARQVGMYLSRQCTIMPLEQIGKAFGRDHATVVHAFQKVHQATQSSITKKNEVEFVRQMLFGQRQKI